MLSDLLDSLEFNQVVIFVKSVSRANQLHLLLESCNFPSMCIHSRMPQEERISRYSSFKGFSKRILVATDIFGRGIDMERVNVVINYDMPDSPDSYLHRVGRAGRFGTKGLAISFVSSDEDKAMLKSIQERFEVDIGEKPDVIDVSCYSIFCFNVSCFLISNRNKTLLLTLLSSTVIMEPTAITPDKMEYQKRHFAVVNYHHKSLLVGIIAANRNRFIEIRGGS